MSEHSSTPRNALSNVPPPNASIDELIRWLGTRRGEHSTLPLSSLIDQGTVSIESLVELAALDLIGQRRRGLDVVAEDYLKQFPRLAGTEDYLLDLIDAELCVRREMNDVSGAEFFISRFPSHADAIRQLVYLEFRPSEIPPLENSRLVVPFSPGTADRSLSAVNLKTIDAQGRKIRGDDSSDSDQFLIQRDLTIAGCHRRLSVPTDGDRNDDSIDVPIPIKPPEWMVGARCIATSLQQTGRSWLVKGRDMQRSDTVAMKIVPLPATIDRTQRTRILDLCEQSSSVAHPAWVAPRIAAVNNGHLAVVRPWIFGNVFSRLQPGRKQCDCLAMLVRVAFALSAAHRIGATHGSVKSSNVILDHEANVNLIDAASGVAAWECYLATWDNDLSHTLGTRIDRDTRGLVQMVATACIESPAPEMLDWIPRLTEGIVYDQPDACACIGESLQSLLDHPPGKRSWWRK